MNFIDSILSLFFFFFCLACGNALYKNEEVICTFCLFRLPKTNFHLDQENPVNIAFRGRIKIETASSFLYFTKGGIIQTLMHQLKYKGHKEVGIYLGRQFGYQLNRSSCFSRIDCIVPVPLHPVKLRLRGYNQSEQIAKGLSQAMHAEIIINNLVRVKHSDSQTRKSRYDRWLNVGDIFNLQRPDEFRNRHVLLVDDVLTTGATLEACALALQKAAGVKISIATLAYAEI